MFDDILDTLLQIALTAVKIFLGVMACVIIIAVPIYLMTVFIKSTVVILLGSIALIAILAAIVVTFIGF